MHPAREDLGISYSIAYAILKTETVSKPHTLREPSEVYFVLEGKGIIHMTGEASMAGPGQAVLIPPGCEQYAEAMGTEDFKLLCIVYPFQ
jgi:mannose-6-phosphate isomerase-like protein (cupin superfamily)